MHYWLRIDHQRLGPYSLDEIRAMLQEGQIEPLTMAAAEGSEDWHPLSSMIQIESAHPSLVTGGNLPRSLALSHRHHHPAVNVSQPKSWPVALIAVVAVIAVLVVAGVLVRNQLANTAREMEAEAKRELVVTEFRRFHAGLDAYRQRQERYPSKEQGLRVIVTDSKAPVDPWGNPYQYEIGPGGTRPVIVSRGPDGKPGTADDMRSDSR